ncbi:MAG: ClpXP protease specificity-enhancing factor SspB [Rickettsiales bacterium]
MERIDYPSLIDEAMRGVVRRVLSLIAKEGLPGKHHFFVSFATDFPGVRISPQLRERYPEEMTIVLQHQFWDLKVQDEQFSIMLSFNNIPEKLVVPYAALTAFADPSIKFGLQFHAHPQANADEHQPSYGQDNDEKFEADLLGDSLAEKADIETDEPKVISLDLFRKK